MTHDQEEPFGIDDDDGLLRAWFVSHPTPDTQGPVLEFVTGLGKNPRPTEGIGTDVVWVPTDEGFQEVGFTWIVDWQFRTIRILDVSDR